MVVPRTQTPPFKVPAAMESDDRHKPVFVANFVPALSHCDLQLLGVLQQVLELTEGLCFEQQEVLIRV
jgi:hypothetical protein